MLCYFVAGLAFVRLFPLLFGSFYFCYCHIHKHTHTQTHTHTCVVYLAFKADILQSLCYYSCALSLSVCVSLCVWVEMDLDRKTADNG